MVEEDAARGVDVRVRILGLAVLGQDAGGDLAVLLDESIDRVLCDVGTCVGEVDEGLEARVGFAQDAVAVAGDDLAGFQRRPEVVFDVLVGEGGADVGLHFEDPAEDFLGGEAVERAREAEEAG